MNPYETLKSAVQQHFPHWQISEDLPEQPQHPHFLDLKNNERIITIEYRPGQGFGLSSSAEPVYGEGPEEVYKDVTPAIERLFAILSADDGKKTSSGQAREALQHQPRVA